MKALSQPLNFDVAAEGIFAYIYSSSMEKLSRDRSNRYLSPAFAHSSFIVLA